MFPDDRGNKSFVTVSQSRVRTLLLTFLSKVNLTLD
jgi:hypothetical protein